MIVLDANAAIAMFNNSPEGEALRLLMHGNEVVAAPDIFQIEVANAFRKYVQASKISSEDQEKSLDKTVDMIDVFYPFQDMLREAYDESIRLRHSIYDVFYLILAQRTASTLFTLDKRLQQLCFENNVRCIYTDDEFGSY